MTTPYNPRTPINKLQDKVAKQAAAIKRLRKQIKEAGR